MGKTKKERKEEKRAIIGIKKAIKSYRKGTTQFVYHEFPHRNTMAKRKISLKRRNSTILFLASSGPSRDAILRSYFLSLSLRKLT